MQPVPPVNIIMSFDYKVMQKFQEYKSLDLFRKDHKESKYFDNSPMSIFVSLTHQLGLKEGKKGALMEVEFLDPEGDFEQKVLSISTQSNLDPNESLLRKAVAEKKGKIKELKKKWEDAGGYDPINISNVIRGIPNENAETLAALTEQIEQEEGRLESIEYSLEESATKGETRLRNLALAKEASKIQKPVYIAYGVGDNLLDWCAPQCFGKLMGVEYNFNTNGARSIKLLYSAISVHPNLTDMGISPLGELGYNTLVSGYSFRIFNEEEYNIRTAKLEKELDDKLNKGTSLFQEEHTTALALLKGSILQKYRKWYIASLHQAISHCMRDFIAKGLKKTKDNVIVLLPNLDNDLAGFVKERKDEIRGRYDVQIKRYARNFGIWKETLEDLGLDISEQLGGALGRTVIGGEQLGLLEDCPDSDAKAKYFQDTKFDVVAEVDNITKTFQEKLDQVSESLSTAASENPHKKMKKMRTNEDIDVDTKYFGATLPVMDPPSIFVETDFNIIQLMLKHGLINDGSQPVVIWGTREMVDLFLYGEIYNKAESMLVDSNGLVDEEAVKSKIFAIAERNLHPYDETSFGANISMDYLKDVYDYVYPSPWIGPFGPTGQVGEDEYHLSDDMNLANKTILSTKGKVRPSIMERQPIFAFGTKNTNILEVAIDINNQYMTLINNSDPSILTGAALADAIVPPGFESEYNTMYKNFKKINLKAVDDNGIPKDFKKLVSSWAVQDKGEVLDINGVGQWDKVFNALEGGGPYENLSDVSFRDEKSSAGNNHLQHEGYTTNKTRKAAYYKFMWEAFSALFAKASKVNRPSPKSTKIYPGKDPSEASLINYAKTVDRMSKMALKGNITTIPMFSLCNRMRVIARPCKLFCIEPQFFNSDNSNLKSKKHLTWFSGAYEMFGFKHTITNSSAKSEFLIARSGGTPDSEGDSDSKEPENPEEVSDGS